ncbi:ankyrin repeat-containing domain protein [Cladorrhinum sp. PSN332]|nr:ankyrin repeat-containing domain protein [Cladorrhinum sp. PSN332]
MQHTQLEAESAADTTVNIANLWKTALIEYENTTGIRIQALDSAKDIEEILSDLCKDEGRFKQRRHDGSKLDKFRTLVSQSLGPVEKLGNIVAQATKASFPPSEAIFAAVRYLISTANAVSADYDRVAGFFEDLKSYLHRLKVLEHKVAPFPALIVVITEVLTSILVLCGICTQYIQMKRIVKAFRSLVSGEDAVLKSAYDRFHKMVEREEGVVRNAILVGITELKSDIRIAQNGIAELKLNVETMQTDVRSRLEGIDGNLQSILTDARSGLAVAQDMDGNLKSVPADIRKMRNYLWNQEAGRAHQDIVEERDEILTWLSPLNFLEKHHAIFEKHHEGTGKWLLDSDPFQKWLNGEQNSTLWCPGDAGAGKTVIVSTMVNYIDERTERSQVAIAFIYCDYRDPTTKSEVEILSSITRQLAEQCKPLPLEVRTFRDRYAGKMTRPSVEERLALIRFLAQRFRRTYILIDALDECPKENRLRFLNLARKLESFVRLLITCRPFVDLQGKFSNLFRLDIVAHESDIQAYLESMIDKDEEMQCYAVRDPNLKRDIIKSLLAKADGMFLLAHLQILLLCDQSSLRNVRRSLNKLPAGIDAFYDIAMARIAEQMEDSRTVVKTALSYIYCARRPLSMEELLHALSVEAGDNDLDETALPHIQFLLSGSVGLIRLDMANGNVSLVHHTLQEYLEAHTDKLLSQPEAEMARTCLRYLTFNELQSGPCVDGESLDQRLQKYRFFGYASHYWGSHFKIHQNDEDMDLLQNFLQDSEKLSSSIQALHIPRRRMNMWFDRFPKQVSPLHVAAYWGLDKVVAIVLGENININSQDSHGATALQLAAKRGHIRVVQLLLENAARVDVADHRGKTALIWASRNGHKTVVELLLGCGAKILEKDNEGWTALHWAIMGRHPELAKVLFSHCAEINLEAVQHNQALILAAEAGSNDIVRMLLDNDAEVDWKDEDGNTALTFAVPLGHEKVVRTLLGKGADVNTRDNYNNTPLHWAIKYPPIVRLLLAQGADANARNDEEKTALHWAAQEGLMEAMRVLVEFNSDLNARDVHGFTALHAASLKGFEEMVWLLLENGANADMRDEDGWTPLHAAILKQHGSIVSLLLKVEDGHCITKQMAALLADDMMRTFWDETAEKKSAGSTAVSGLRSAVNSGHVERVLALLEDGVDVDAEDIVGGSTALTIAASQGLRDIVQTLLENGADINKPDRSGRTALHHAAVAGNTDLVELLVENGADLEARVHGWTALLLAAKDWFPLTAVYLVRQRANVDAGDYHGRRVLHWAARNGSEILTRLVLDKGADPNAMDRWGRTPLMWAVKSRNHVVAKLLLELGADSMSKARDRTTALHMAAFVGDKTLTDWLLTAGADCNARALGGLTALHIAAFMGYQSVAGLLLERGADASEEFQWCVEKYGHEGFDIDRAGDVDKSLCSWLRRLLHEHGTIDGIECLSSFSVGQLAIIGGSTAMLGLLR